MLTLFTREQGRIADDPGQALRRDVAWYDLFDPAADEIHRVEDALGVHLPTREEIEGIGLASPNRTERDTLHLHMTLYSENERTARCSPLAMVVTRGYLVTLRGAGSAAIEGAAERLGANHEPADGPGAFATLLETVANHVAAQMQDIADDVAITSTRIFVRERLDTRSLRRLILRVGELESRLTQYRTSLLGFDRLLGFVHHRLPDWIAEPVRVRFKIVENDLRSLDKFDEQLTGKLQFLLDAILGFINTDQNGVMKVLTIASVVTVPPIILAAVWGMNFRHMPELVPVWAYPLALLAIALSIVVPLLWFRRLGWLSKE
jgi:magnesium transporter